MAGDWIKIELSLPEKSEVWQIAGILGIDADMVVGKLIKVWRWFDQHTENGNAPNVTYALLDHITGVTGFAEAMSFSGWLVQDKNTLTLPHFDRHNGKTGKNRALTAKRVANHKAKIGNDEVTHRTLPREEKNRYKRSKSSSPHKIDRQKIEDQKPIEISRKSRLEQVSQILKADKLLKDFT